MFKKDFLLIFVLFFFDQLAKFYAVKFLSFYKGLTIIPHVLYFQLVHNYGAAYGIFQNQRLFLLIVGSLVILSCFCFAKKIIQSYWSRYALIFLLGGALGNVVDRFRLGYVVDFIDIRIFPVFNLADMMINVAVICFLIEMFFYDVQNNKKSN